MSSPLRRRSKLSRRRRREHVQLEPSTQRQIFDLTRSGLSPLRVLGRYHYASAQPELERHSHGEMIEICYLESGRQTYEVNGREYPLVGGDVFLTLPGEPHGSGAHPEARGVLYWLLISVAEARRSFLHLPKPEGRWLLERLLNAPRRCFSGRASLRAILRAIFALRTGPHNRHRTLELRCLFTRLLLDLTSSAYERRPTLYSPNIQAAIRCIEAHRTEPLLLARLAKHAGLSLPRLKSKFKQEVGIPPAEYIVRQKVEQAADWLHTTPQTVTDVAMRLGFSSSQYFATVFRRYTMRTPRDARTQRVHLS